MMEEAVQETVAVARADGPTLIVASSDMSHYLEDAEARVVDKLALAPLAAADPRAHFSPTTVPVHVGEVAEVAGARVPARAEAVPDEQVFSFAGG